MATREDVILSWTDAPDILTAKEAAKLLRVGASIIYQIASEEPDFPAVRIGKHIRIPKPALKSWFERKAAEISQST